MCDVLPEFKGEISLGSENHKLCIMCDVLSQFEGEISLDSEDFEMCTMCDVLPEFKGEISPIARTSRCVLCVTYYPSLRVRYPR